eukprot:Phypoly_transcript_19987.p1 GENE.Phypoly_transcript_19987~~Phypoly_transcript_19987.p1  ORF type:complete len:102 (+),score=31.55 Phypoly_transcript_19987:380-685(+)
MLFLFLSPLFPSSFPFFSFSFSLRSYPPPSLPNIFRQVKGTVLPLKTSADHTLQVGKIADYDKNTRVFEVLRKTRADAKLVGIRADKAKKKEGAAEAAKQQ